MFCVMQGRRRDMQPSIHTGAVHEVVVTCWGMDRSGHTTGISLSIA